MTSAAMTTTTITEVGENGYGCNQWEMFNPDVCGLWNDVVFVPCLEVDLPEEWSRCGILSRRIKLQK